jgi:anti-anti-sigma factor
MTKTDSFLSDRVGDRTRVLTLNGSCNVSTAFGVEQGIAAALNSGTTEIIFDLRGVSSLGSPFLHVLFRGLIQAKRRSGSLVLVRPNDYVWAKFESSGLDHVFVSFTDLKDAIAVQRTLSPPMQ